jgi:beta-1,4-mannooligosaccharide/beta-1,4-mannosyl-N-acetylglucosamine phosphorylase
MSNEIYRELFKRHPHNPLLTAEDWPYPCNSVFNAGATKFEDDYLLLVRVEDHKGFSHLTVARSFDGITNWRIDQRPTMPPLPEDYPEEMWGIEDPRITRIEGSDFWAVAYTAFSRGGPLVSLATTRDFKTFDRLGPVMPPDDKDAALFPVRFDGRWAMLHRPVGSGWMGAHIWVSFSPDLKHWGDHKIVLRARSGGWWDANKIGLSPPPLETPEGWLMLYHGVRHTPSGCIYRLGLALLDRNNLTRVLRRGDEWVFSPKVPYERDGDVDDVVFPAGWVLEGDMLRIYYGGADSCIALATASLRDVLDYLRQCPEGGEGGAPF